MVMASVRAGRVRECGYLRCYIMRNVPEVSVKVRVRVMLG